MAARGLGTSWIESDEAVAPCVGRSHQDAVVHPESKVLKKTGYRYHVLRDSLTDLRTRETIAAELAASTDFVQARKRPATIRSAEKPRAKVIPVAVARSCLAKKTSHRSWRLATEMA